MADNALPISHPAAQGVDPRGILAFVDAVEQTVTHLHSFILIRHGHIVAQGWWHPYDAGTPHMLFSLTKSFTSTAVGMAIHEGLVTLDDPVLRFFPDDAPPDPSPNLQAMKIRHLLSMSTGHEADASAGFRRGADPLDGRRAFFRQPITHAPGTHFVYNSGASQMLAEILFRQTGQTLRDYLTPRLFIPLGIEPADWEVAPSGTNTGGWGLTLTTDDIARFGQLILQKGLWRGRRLVPADWIETASQKHISNGSDPNSEWAQGYGFQFWRCRHGAFRGDGAFGQYCILMPQQDAVLAMTGGVNDLQAPMTAAWQHLLPAMGTPRPEDAATTRALNERLAGLTLPMLAGRPEGNPAISGRTYRFPADPATRTRALCFTFDSGICRAALTDDAGTHTIPFACGGWAKSQTDTPNPAERLTAGNYAWTDDNTLNTRLWFRLSPWCHDVTCRFSGDTCAYESRVNVSFQPIEKIKAIGRVET